MIGTIRKLGLVWPTLLTLLGLSILVSLGTWQLQRKAWKDDLASRISARADAPPVVLSTAEDVERWAKDDGSEYSNVRIRGSFDHSKERYLYVPHKNMGPGYDVFTPLMLSGDRVVWVNRGYVSEKFKAANLRGDGQVSGLVDVVGRIRFAGIKSTFTPLNDVDQNQWYWSDIPSMHASAFGEGDALTFPFYVVASSRVRGSGEWPKAGLSKVEIFNRHLEYALTWFGLALTLLGVFAAYAWKRVRELR